MAWHLEDALMKIRLFENENYCVFNWTEQDCHSWALQEIKTLGLNPGLTDVNSFLNFSGRQLITLTAEDFVTTFGPTYGHTFYERLQELLLSQAADPQSTTNQSLTEDSILPDLSNVEDHFWADSYPDHAHRIIHGAHTLPHAHPHALTSARAASPEESTDLYLSPSQSEEYIDLQPLSSFTDIYGDDAVGIDFDLLSLPPLNCSSSSSFSPSPSSSSSSSSSFYSYSSPLPPITCPSPPFQEEEEENMNFIPQGEDTWREFPPYTPSGMAYRDTPTPTPPDTTTPPTPTPPDTTTPPTPKPKPARNSHRGQRRAALTPMPTGELLSDGPLQPLQTRSRNRSRGPKSWEFVMRLIASPHFNPSYVSWENKEQGTFKFQRPAEIAKMWGERSANTRDREVLSYDNFARGLRYHYNTGALQPVSERQLVYKCGRKALDFLKLISQEENQY